MYLTWKQGSDNTLPILERGVPRLRERLTVEGKWIVPPNRKKSSGGNGMKKVDQSQNGQADHYTS